jgi:L-lactate dehydrogenase (cytochrome)
MQLYVDRNRPKTEKLLGVINGFEGMKGIFVTVDAAAPGKREADERSRAEIEVVSWPGGRPLGRFLASRWTAPFPFPSGLYGQEPE